MINIILIVITTCIIQYIIIYGLKYLVKKYYNNTLLFKALFDDRYTQFGHNNKNLNKLF